jgi:probable rRNA maturation factor
MDPAIIFDSSSRAALGRRVTQRSLTEFAATLQKRVAKGRPFDCMITGDDELRRLNRQFRKKNQPTDVLSFPSDPSTPSKLKPLGELAISADRALEQSREHGHSVGDEIRILMLHGLLHLLGMDHEADAGQMARAETRWRKTLALPTGLIERTRS